MSWFEPHSVVEVAGFVITALTFAWNFSARLTRMETKLDLLMSGRELLKVRK